MGERKGEHRKQVKCWRERQKRDGVVDIEFADAPQLTAWGGLALAERLACRTRLWSSCRKRLPERTQAAGGYHTTTVVAALVHGLLSGAQGTWAAEALREDAAACRAAGFGTFSVPEEATVWRTLGQLDGAGGQAALGDVMREQACRLLQATPRRELMIEGFFPAFGDGTWIEVGTQSKYEGTKMFDGVRKLLWSVCWAGPYVAGQSFASAGEDERAATLRLIEPTWREVLEPAGLAAQTLWLLDSLYGDGPCLDELERCEGSFYVVGANKLAGVEAAAIEQAEALWHSVPALRTHEEAALCVHGYQAAHWLAPRTVVTRRFKKRNEMLWHYRSIFTNLEPSEPRIAQLMAREQISFASAVWRLYDQKQACENQFKDLLRDLGLHHPPCRQLGRNAIFYAIAAVALNLAVAMRRIGLRGREARMSLARLRRMLLALPARTAWHARRTKVLLYSTSNRLRALFAAAFARLAAC